jgi:RiboL-PSP-HEPN
MSYSDSFVHADDVVNHLNSIVIHVTDPFIKQKYAGFVAVAAVTVYEVAIKKIFIEFSSKKHHVLESFTASFFDRINGRIKIEIIKHDYIKPFGDRYLQKFEKKLLIADKEYLITHRRSIKNSYSNLIRWRNDFAHEGIINNTSTYEEVVQAYADGKFVIKCLSESMNR